MKALGRLLLALTLVDKLHPFTGEGERLQLKNTQLCCTAHVVPLSPQLWSWLVGIQDFGIGTGLHAGIALRSCMQAVHSYFQQHLPLSESSTRELLAELKQEGCATHGCSCCCAPGTSAEGLCQNLKNFSCSLNGSAACSVPQKVANALIHFIPFSSFDCRKYK